MPNPGLPPDKKALIRSSLDAGISPAAVAKLTIVSNLRDFGELTFPTLAKFSLAKAMWVHMENINNHA